MFLKFFRFKKFLSQDDYNSLLLCFLTLVHHFVIAANKRPLINRRWIERSHSWPQPHNPVNVSLGKSSPTVAYL